eukprot:Opistho-2@40529
MNGGSTFFSMNNCIVERNSATEDGGAIAVDGRSQLHFQQCVFRGNSANNGGMIRVVGSQSVVSLNGSILASNTARQNGGAVYVGSEASIDVENCVIERNTAGLHAGAFYAPNWSVMNARKSIVRENSAAMYGGAIYSNGLSTGTISGCDFDSNKALRGGVLAYDAAAQSEETTKYLSFSFFDSTFRNNSATEIGGVICILFVDVTSMTPAVTLIHGYASGNLAPKGGFLSVSTPSNAPVDMGGNNEVNGVTAASIVLSNMLIADSGEGIEGGALHLKHGGLLQAYNVTFSGCTADKGGSIYMGDDAIAHLTLCIVISSTGTSGGGIMLSDKSHLTLDGGSAIVGCVALVAGGGILAESSSTLIVSESEATDNRASMGGFMSLSGYAVANVASGQWMRNRAEVHGGAVYMNAFTSLLITTMTATENCAGYRGGAIATDGYARVRLQKMDSTSYNALNASLIVFTGNSATQGGAMHLSIGASAVLSSVLFHGNVASEAGGAVFATGCSELHLSSSTMQGNLATPSGDGGAVAFEDLSLVLLAGVRMTGNEAQSGGALFGRVEPRRSVCTSASKNATNAAAKGDNGLGEDVFCNRNAIQRRRRQLHTRDMDDELYDAFYDDLDGGIYRKASIAVRRCVFEGNVAVTEGGAVRIAGQAKGVLRYCNVTGNVVTATGDSGVGSAVYWGPSADAPTNALRIVQSTITHNNGTYGTLYTKRPDDSASVFAMQVEDTIVLNNWLSSAQDQPGGAAADFGTSVTSLSVNISGTTGADLQKITVQSGDVASSAIVRVRLLDAYGGTARPNGLVVRLVMLPSAVSLSNGSGVAQSATVGSASDAVRAIVVGKTEATVPQNGIAEFSDLRFIGLPGGYSLFTMTPSLGTITPVSVPVEITACSDGFHMQPYQDLSELWTCERDVVSASASERKDNTATLAPAILLPTLAVCALVGGVLWWRIQIAKKAASLATHQQFLERHFRVQESALKLASVEVDHESIDLTDPLGQGEFGMVHKALLTAGDRPRLCAAKSMRDGTTFKERIDFIAEAEVMLGLQHPNIISLVGVAVKKEPILILLEFAPHGNLKSFVQDIPTHRRDSRNTKTLLATFAAQIAKGMGYLASMKIVHRDLAARNCMVAQDVFGDYVVKVADFGLSRRFERSYYQKKSKGGRLPFKWMSPEALSGVYSEKSDVWSWGVTIFEAYAFGASPYPGYDPAGLARFLRDGERLDQPDACPWAMYNLLCECWAYEAARRPSFTDIGDRLALIAQLKPSRSKEGDVGDVTATAIESGSGVAVGITTGLSGPDRVTTSTSKSRIVQSSQSTGNTDRGRISDVAVHILDRASNSYVMDSAIISTTRTLRSEDNSYDNFERIDLSAGSVEMGYLNLSNDIPSKDVDV